MKLLPKQSQSCIFELQSFIITLSAFPRILIMKAIWKGSISFGLVTIPVELYSAIEEHTFGFKLLHKKCHTPISYERHCDHCNQIIDWHDVVKGIKLSDGTYFILTQEKLNALKPSKTDTIDVVQFVDSASIDTIYYEHHYYVIPAATHTQAYFLFIAALKKLNKTGIGRFVMRDKEYVCALQPYEQGMLLSTLNYAYEIRKLDTFNKLRAPKLPAKQLALAQELIQKLSAPLNMKQFKDTFATKLKAKIKKGTHVTIEKKPKKKPEAKPEPSLMSSLQSSLRAYERHAPAHAPVHARARS